jgi:hypothetical protein
MSWLIYSNLLDIYRYGWDQQSALLTAIEWKRAPATVVRRPPAAIVALWAPQEAMPGNGSARWRQGSGTAVDQEKMR